jgi:ABC-2 type transport system permease protein
MEFLTTTDVTDTKQESSSASFGALATLYDQRWLVTYYIRRQLASNYRTSFLGGSWMFLVPLLMVVLYTLIFSEIIGVRFGSGNQGDSTLNFGLYLYCGLIPYLAFSEAVIRSVTSILNNATLVANVVFPIEILPLSATVVGLITNTVGLGALIVIMVILGQPLYWTLLLLPLIIVLQLLFVLGLSYIAAVFGTYVPDAKEVVNTVVRTMLFITPIMWPPEMVPERLRFVVDYNPLAYLVGAYRDLVLEGSLPGSMETLWFGLLACSLSMAGFILFIWFKPHFADLV